MLKIYGNSAPRAIVGKALASIYDSYSNVVVIDNDLATATNTYDFFKKYPKNFIELGIGEQSSLSAACGLSLEGFVPFYVNFAIFATGTIWTQIRQAAYANLNIKIVATHPGLDAGLDGASHQATQDLALMRCLPNVRILMPSDIYEVKAALQYAYSNSGVYYVRVSREPVPEIYNETDKIIFDIKNKELINYGDNIAIIFDGSTLEIALESIELLKKNAINARLIHARSIKPLDVENLDFLLNTVQGIVTLENHSVIGGLGSAVAEYMASKKSTIPLGIVGVQDTFTSSGISVDLKKKYGVSADKVLEKAKFVLADF